MAKQVREGRLAPTVGVRPDAYTAALYEAALRRAIERRGETSAAMARWDAEDAMNPEASTLSWEEFARSMNANRASERPLYDDV